MHGGNLWEAKELYGEQEFIDLSANINPFGPPEGVWEALQKSLKAITHYPDPQYRRLRRKMAHKYNLPEEMILLGNGAGELIYLLLHGLRPGKVLIPQPAFGEYERAALACECDIKKVTLGREGWRNLNIQSFLKKLDCHQILTSDGKSPLKFAGDLIFINSPHNPTGSSLSREDFEKIMGWAKEQGIWVVLDESFVDFLPDEKRWSGREYLNVYANLLVLYSLTKFYAIPGLRLGAVFAHPQVLKHLKEQQDPWAVNVLAEEAGLAALEDQEYEVRVRKLLQESKDFFYREFTQANMVDLELFPSDVNFALLQIRRGDNPAEQAEQKKNLVKNLGQQGILVRDCGNFHGFEGEYLRLAIKDHKSMSSLLKALKNYGSMPL